jgi:threonine synthase
MANNSELKAEAIDYVKQKIAGCFGSDDGIFAGHQTDEDRAKELRQFAANKGLSLDEVSAVAMDYMQQKGYIKDHIDEQMPEIRKFFKKKIS